ncbi:LysR family transcriptional regulator [Archangium minus]|uniref:LysR family transcriptional regulator n=1 Tax=Archangium minus TaxID=83450 RepID=A0ABY9X577_9BACT|nr:LysR family transcriptional regulator [Archangium minus]
MRDEFGGLAAFLAVAEKRSFKAAAVELGVTRAAVSQTIRQVEERLGVRLLQRTTRSVGLTEAGEHLYRGLQPAFSDMRATLESLNELRSRPSGTLRLSISSIAEDFLSEKTLAEFLAEYPDIKLDISVDDNPSGIFQQGFDAGVQLGEIIDKDMVAVSISGEQRQLVVGSPGYFAVHGKPQHPRELHAHACIGWRMPNGATYRWEFTEKGRDFEIAIDARVNTNEKHLMLRLACDGVGLTIGMEDSFRPYIQRGELLPVLEEFCPPFAGFYLYYPSRAQTPLKLKALVEFLRKRARSRARRK